MDNRKRAGIPRWVLASLLASLLLCCGGGATVVWVIDRAVSQQVGVAVRKALEPAILLLDFEMLLKVENVEGAYRLTSEGFQGNSTLEGFAGMIKRHPELRAPWEEISIEEQRDDALWYRVRVAGEGNARSEFRIELRKENSAWKVERLLLP